MQRQTVQAERIKSSLTNTEVATSGERALLLLLFTGQGRFLSNEVEREIDGPCLIWAPTNWSSRIALRAGARGYLLRMPERALGRAMPTDALSAHVREVVSRRIFFSEPSEQLIASVTTLFEKMEAELHSAAPGSETVMHHCVSLLLIDIWRAAASPRQSTEKQPHRVSDSFLGLVELHLRNHWTIQEYASRIGVSRDRLNASVRRAIGVPPHTHIQRRLMEEAKALLVTTNLNVSEVAYRLGFGDAAYFTRFFRRHESLAPAQFRRTYTPLYQTRTEDVSFAEWP